MASEPNYVRSFLDSLHPDEEHGAGGDCLTPNCDYEFSSQDERNITDFDGHFTCPQCDQSYNLFEVGKPGGTSKSGLTNTQMGWIAEQVVQQMGEIPGLGPIIQYLGDDSYHGSLDMIVGQYGVEIKSNHSESQPRFKIGGEKVQDPETGQVIPARQAKYLYCQRTGLIPALIGVRLNFYTSKADIFVRKGSHAFDDEGFNDTWIGSPKLTYIDTVDFSDLNPFSHPDHVPLATELPPGSWEAPASEHNTEMKLAKWQDIMEKAKRLRQSGQVHVLNNSGEHIVGTVEGDHGTYGPSDKDPTADPIEIWRNDPNSRAIAYWNCPCPWGEVSWGRTRQWKKYEGRMCSHALALYWEAQGTPLDEEPEMPEMEPETGPETPMGEQPIPADILPEEQESPAEEAPEEAPLSPAQEAPASFAPEDLMQPAIPGGPNIPPPTAPSEDIVPAEVQPEPEAPEPMEPPPPPMEPAVQSQPKQPGQTGPLDIPGALSKVANEEDIGLLYRSPESNYAHDYHPSWDKEQNESVDPQVASDINQVCQNIYNETMMPFECWAVHLAPGVVAEYVNGTSDYPVILIDIDAHRGYEDQFYQSIRHELAHAEQEAEGLDFDEEDAEHWDDRTGGFLDDLFAVPFKEGDTVKIKPGAEVQGIDRDQQWHTIPEGTAGEVMYCDSADCIVMFPLKGSYLTPQLVKAETSPDNLYAADDASPFVKKRRG